MWSRLGRVGLSLLLSGCAQEGCTGELAPDGGFVPGVSDVTDTPCESKVRALSWEEETPLGFAAGTLRPMLEGVNTETVLWTNGKRAVLEVELWDLRASFVEQRVKAGYVPTSYGDSCTNYVRIDAMMYINTSDGQLSNIERPFSLRTFSNEEAFGSMMLDLGSFEGSFVPDEVPATCVRSLKLKLLMSESGPAGSLTQEHSTGRCEDADQTIRKEILVGHWGVRWQSY